MGVVTAAWAGLFAALFSSSNYNIVGPTGALSGLLANYAQLYLFSLFFYIYFSSPSYFLLFFDLVKIRHRGSAIFGYHLRLALFDDILPFLAKV